MNSLPVGSGPLIHNFETNDHNQESVAVKLAASDARGCETFPATTGTQNVGMSIQRRDQVQSTVAYQQG